MSLFLNMLQNRSFICVNCEIFDLYVPASTLKGLSDAKLTLQVV